VPVKGTLPLMVNMAGMIASSLLIAIDIPRDLASFATSQAAWVRNTATTVKICFGRATFTDTYFILVVATFFYTNVLFQSRIMVKI
jgi:preprotein translocase subunit SecY